MNESMMIHQRLLFLNRERELKALTMGAVYGDKVMSHEEPQLLLRTVGSLLPAIARACRN